MKSFTLPLILILFLSSCITTNYVNYIDPNYLNSDEFSSYEEITSTKQEEPELLANDSTMDSQADYKVEDYYDYTFSSRIRRFHRPMHYSGYYGGIYTDYYWYNNDPFACGSSIYYGYNWHSPYYSIYSYSPYYFSYYSPHYYGSHYGYYGYNTYYTKRNKYNSYITGRRGNLSSNIRSRGTNANRMDNILSNTNQKNSTLRTRDNNALNNNRKYNSQSTIKTNNRNKATIEKNTNRNSTGIKNSNSRSNLRTNSNRTKNSYSNKTSPRSYRNNKSNTRNKSSRGGTRGVSPR